MDLPSATSPANIPALDERWAEKLFRRMENFYGQKWIDSFGGIPRERVKQAWAEELAGYRADEIVRGIDGCRAKPWPPTLPEFLLLCRPPVDARADWAEACEQMRVRLAGGEDRWSRPQVYWAAVAVGFHDLQAFSWEQIRPRWERSLAIAGSEPVPAWMKQLPAPGDESVTAEVARERIAVVAENVAALAGQREAGSTWAVRLMRREASGEPLCLQAGRSWRDALGFEHGIDAAAALRRFEQEAAHA